MFVHAYRCNESLSMRIFGHPTRKCICSPKQVSSYLSKVSGPLLDRFDIHLEVAPVEFADLSSTAKEESSASIRERVQKARDIQNERFKGTSITCNARITSDILHEVCPVTDEASKLLENVFDSVNQYGKTVALWQRDACEGCLASIGNQAYKNIPIGTHK